MSNASFGPDTTSEDLSLALLSGPTEGALHAAFDQLRKEPRGSSGGAGIEIRVAAPPEYRAAYLLGGSGGQAVQAPVGVAASSARPVAWMFPGLGDQYLRMGEQLYRSLPTFKQHVDQCAELLKPQMGIDLREVIYPLGGEEPSAPKGGLDLRRMLGRDGRAPTANESRLNQTRIAQPALFVIEYALAKVLQEWGVQPAAMIGYSLGEYVAACLSGVLTLEDSLSLVARRAELIDTLPPGAMLAVMLPEAQLVEQLRPGVTICAVNGPEFCVVAGPPEEVQALEKQLAERGVTVRQVRTTHAFHSPMMAPIAEQVTALARSYSLKAPTIPYASNLTGKLITAAQATDPGYWAEHLTRPVRFSNGLEALPSLSDLLLVEAGPGQSLSSIASTVFGASARDRIASAMRNTFDATSDIAVLYKAMGRLWVSGAGVDWKRFPSRPLAVADEGKPVAAASAGSTESSTFDTPTEQQLLDLWKQLFADRSLTPTVSFFELGGNSLTATRLVQRIQKTFNVKLSLKHVYGAPTLRGMATAIDEVRANPKAPARQAPKATASAADTAPTLTLPNGLVVRHQNEAETRHFYDDIFAHRSYVRFGIVLRDGACVFDIGANIGLFTLFAHNEAKDVRVFSFEPAPPTYSILKANRSEHGVQGTVLNCGLSNSTRDASFTFYPRSSGMSTFQPDVDEEKHNLKTIIANQRRAGEETGDAAESDELLDVRFQPNVFTAHLRRASDVIREYGIERIDLMKIDVQKCELEVIEGIDDADWPKIGQVVLEVHDTDGRVQELRSRLERQGMSVVVHQDELYVGTNIYNLYAVRSA